MVPDQVFVATSGPFVEAAEEEGRAADGILDTFLDAQAVGGTGEQKSQDPVERSLAVKSDLVVQWEELDRTGGRHQGAEAEVESCHLEEWKVGLKQKNSQNEIKAQSSACST